MKRTVAILLASSSTACAPEATFLPGELAPGEHLLALVLDANGAPRSGHVVAADDRGLHLELAEGESIVRGRFGAETFAGPDGRPLAREVLEGLMVSATPGPAPIASPVYCSERRPIAPLLVHRGDVCPLPPFLELVRDRVESGALVRRPLETAERLQIDDSVRLAWAGTHACSEPPTAGATAELDVEIAYGGLPVELPRRLDDYTSMGNTPDGLLGVAGSGRFAIIARDGSFVSSPAQRVDDVLGLPGRRFLLGRHPTRSARASLELMDETAGTLATVELDTPPYELMAEYYFDPGTLLVAGATIDRIFELHVCALRDAAPRLECRLLLALHTVLSRFGEATVTRFDNGVLLLSTSNSDLLFLERLPAFEELTSPAPVTSARTGTIDTAGGPLRWRVAPAQFVAASGAPLLHDDWQGIRASAFGDRAIVCFAIDADSRTAHVATATISADIVDPAVAVPVFRTVHAGLPDFCRPAPRGAGDPVMRVNFTYGGWLDLDRDGAIAACAGPPCTTPGRAPLSSKPGPVRVGSQWPGWTIGVSDNRRRVYLRRDAEGTELPVVLDGPIGWFGALAARGRELWAFHTGDGAVATSTLTALDPPIHVPAVFAPGEVPMAAAYDSAADSFVVAGTTRDLQGRFFRRVTPDERAEELVIPEALRAVGWPTSAAEITAGRVLVATSDARLLLVEGDVLREIPIDHWDDPTTPNEEIRPDGCDTVVPFFPHGGEPIIRDVAGAGGVALAGACRNTTLRAFLHGDTTFVEGLNPAGLLIVDDDIWKIAAACPNRLYGASRDKVFQGLAPHTGERGAERRGQGYAFDLFDEGGERIADLLVTPQRVVIVRSSSGVGTIRVAGSSVITSFPSQLVNAVENDEGVVLISTADDQLLLAR